MDAVKPSGAEVVYGLRAALAVLATRRGDVERAAYSRDVKRELEPHLAKIPTREETPDGLARLAKTQNHEGVVLFTKPRRYLAQGDLVELLVRAKGTAIALDRVRNAYNIGAIVRTAAFFGVDAMILGAPAPHPGLAPDAVRVAEGGAEHVAMARTTDLVDTLSRLKKRGVAIVGADGESPTDASTFSFTRPCVLVVGHEREGLGDRVRGVCDSIIAIRGAGTVESLNVAIATSVLVASMIRP